MPNDTVVLNLDGDIPLNLFAQALSKFSILVQELDKEVGEGASIRWMISRLEAGSALTEARGFPATEESLPAVERIADAYLTVGTAIAQSLPIPYSRNIRRTAQELAGLLNGDIRSMRFENSVEDITITKPTPNAGLQPLPVAVAYGAVEGRVQTLSSRGTLRFTIYDLVYDKAVSCYLAEGYQETMRDMWGKIAIVEGRAKRDAVSGRPLTVRQVKSVHSLDTPIWLVKQPLRPCRTPSTRLQA